MKSAMIIFKMSKDIKSNVSKKHRTTNGRKSSLICVFCKQNEVFTAVKEDDVWTTYRGENVHSSCYNIFQNGKKRVRKSEDLRKKFFQIVETETSKKKNKK